MKTEKLPNEQFPDGRKPIGEGTFRFGCYPGVKCFTLCCRDVDMYLYPYDIIRLKNRLGISSDQFLEQYTFNGFRDNPHFPSFMLKMSDDEKKSCPFLSSEGCTIYEDRPSSCRTYPLERAVARDGDEKVRNVFYFIANHPYCLGHKEPRDWTVKEWRDDQEVELYDKINDLWVDVDTIFRGNPWGSEGINSPKLKMALMACFNVDEFKTFLFQTTFLSRFDVPEERIEQIKESDVELMQLGFDWVRFFLTGTGTFTPREN
ncbi:MAG: YkgJ family cysteine cluster protein [Deltaproteobacteria bacterium]|nr:YkgJ family cysteine cluster protein [Deltaproteobacteria bacterium]